MRLKTTLLCTLLLIMLVCPIQSQAKPATSVPVSRLARLMRGAAIGYWFWGVPGDQETPDHFKNYLTDADLQLLHKLGLQFVRLSISPTYLYDPNHPETLETTVLSDIDRAIDRFLAHDLAVIVDLHAGFDPEVALLQLETNPHAAGKFAAFWQALAKHMSHYDPEMVYFEIVNEPHFVDHPEQWSAIQAQAVKAIRTAAPNHTIIATGPLWSLIDGLSSLSLVDDPDVIYTIHFYEPLAFTHQGADWVDGYAALKNVPYPTDAKACAQAIAAIKDAKAKQILNAYCHDEHWDAAQIQARIGLAAAWAQQHQVPLFMGEFGVYSLTAPADARLRWIADTRAAVEQAGIGWTVWYDDTFGLQRQVVDGHITLDQGVVKAMGLNAAALSAQPSQPQAATPAPPDDISALNDEFDNAQTRSNWTLNSDVEGYPKQVQTLDINTSSSGNLYVVPYASSWFGDLRGVYLYKHVTGDFIVTTRLKVTGKHGEVPTLNYSLAGLLVRNPRNVTPDTWQPGQENWLFIAAGCGDPGIPQIETKTTVNSNSELTLKPRQPGWLNLRIARIGSLFLMMYQYDGKSWVINQRFSRPDLPQTLQVGLHAYTNWDAMPSDISDYNKTLLSDAPADLIAQFDYVRFVRPQVPTDTATALKAGKTVADATLLKAVGIDASK